MTERNPTLIFVSGPSKSGKTTLIERLIPRLRQKGLRVGTIKHAHKGFQMDHPGKDSFRHTQAGASAVSVVAPGKSALLVQEGETSLPDAVSQMARYVNLILMEGYRSFSGPKVVLEPGGAERLRMEGKICTIGVPPETLSSSELEVVVRFCREKGVVQRKTTQADKEVIPACR